MTNLNRSINRVAEAPRRPEGAPDFVVAVPLRNGGWTWVDQKIAKRFRGRRWRRRDERGYVVITFPGEKVVYLHRLVCRAKEGQLVHHRDGNPLHNWRSNLSLCDEAENAHVRAKRTGTSRLFIGVYFDRERGVWRAQITTRAVRKDLGRYPSEDAAAHARDEAVRSDRRRRFRKFNRP